MRGIAEILEHWQAGRSICAISRCLSYAELPFVSMFTLPKSGDIVRVARRQPEDGRKAFLREVIPKPPDPSTRPEVFARLLPYQEEIREALAITTVSTIWQRLRNDKRVMVSQPSFYR